MTQVTQPGGDPVGPPLTMDAAAPKASPSPPDPAAAPTGSAGPSCPVAGSGGDSGEPAVAAGETSPAGSAGEAPALRTARRTGLIDQVIEQLREQIVAGTWPIGSRIPTEAELAHLTGTSRNTIREAVQSLVHAGLLERRQGSGTYVLAASELAGAVSRRVAGAHQHHVLEVRRALEAGAARLAAQRRTREDVDRMLALIAARNRAAERNDLAGVAQNDLALHRAIGQAAHNPVLTDLYEHFLDAVYENILHNTMAGRGRNPTEHVGLVDAIREQDGDRAAAEAACDLDHALADTERTQERTGRPGAADPGER